MDEDEYRSAYGAVNQRKCVYEKAVLSRQAGCSQAQVFCLAERYGVACESEAAHVRCQGFIADLREASRFALGLPRINGPLPHSKEMKVQVGGLRGLRSLTDAVAEGSDPIEDIAALLLEVRAGECGGMFPGYDRLVQFVVHYKARLRRK